MYVIRSIARILVVKLDPDILHMFGIPDDFLKQQKLMETESLNKKVITDAEMSPAFRKLCFLTVVKWSNSVYPPDNTKMNLYTIANISFIITRYSEEAMQKVFGSCSSHW